jgi:autotransporter-associated beta strand protein
MAFHHSILSKTTAGVLVVLAVCFMTTAARGVTSTFVKNATTWGAAASWADGDQSTPPTTGGGSIPDAPGDIAIFQQLISGNGGLMLNLGAATRTLGVLTVRDAALPGNYTGTLAIQDDSKTLIFDNLGSPAELNELGDTVAGDAGRLRITAAIQLNSNLNVTVTHNLDKNSVTEIAGRLIGGDNITITKLGAGSFMMGYAPTPVLGPGEFLGFVDVQQGELRMINPNATPSNNNPMLSASKGVYIHDGTQIQLGNHITSWGLGANSANADGLAELVLEGIGDSNTMKTLTEGALRFDQGGTNAVTCEVTSPIKLQSTASHTSPRIYVDAAAVTGVLKKVVRGDATAGLNKGGNGVLVLMNADGNTYAGQTTVTKGSLVVNNTTSTTSGVGTGAVVISDFGSGANLAGTGFIGTVANPVNVSLTHDTGSTITAGARLYPGDLVGKPSTVSSPGTLDTHIGTLTIHGNLTFDSLASLNVDINHTAADQVVDFGDITLGGAGMNFATGTPSLDGTETFTLIDNQGSNAINGEFGFLNGVAGTYTEGSTIHVGPAKYTLTYAGGAGSNDVMLIGAGLLGDFNGDTNINAADYPSWRKNNGTDSGYAEWRENFSEASASGPGMLTQAAVPEPATIILVVLIAPFFAPLVARRKHGRTRS